MTHVRLAIGRAIVDMSIDEVNNYVHIAYQREANDDDYLSLLRAGHPIGHPSAVTVLGA